MATITIKIEEPNSYGHYHALDAVVQAGDTIEIETSIDTITFTVVIDNTNGFFANSTRLITKQVTKAGGPENIGTISSLGHDMKVYHIYDNSGTIPGVDPDAPPRIIRVA